MILSLFKSRSQRSAEAIQAYINALKGLDAEGLAGVALYCSYTRLAELRHISVHAPPETFRKFVWLYYDPILLEMAFIETALGRFEQSLAKIEKNRPRCAHNAIAQSMFGLLGAGAQAWRNTWLGCLHDEVRYLSQEMWALISLGFPLVEQVSEALMREPYFKTAPQEVQLFEAIIRHNGDGPDYAKIPEGFRPKA